MTIYICKCGRRVSKSTNADNTGNRDTENCKGCPYLLPWGPTEWTGVSFVQNVKGYECRMSPEISYATDYSGSANDKCTLKIHSLDLDFLEDIQAWIDEYADGQLSGRFSRDTIHGTDYCNEGRYSWSISCAQNKKGMAAKAALIERFFGPDGHRLDTTPEEEKAIVLAAIEAGKAKAQERKESMEYTISKHVATGRLYAYYKGSLWFWDEHVQKWLLSQFAEDLYQERQKSEKNFTREDLLSETADFYLLDGYEVDYSCIAALLQCNPKKAEVSPCETCQCPECSDDNCPQAHCDKSDGGMGCTAPDEDCPAANPTDAAPASLADAGAATQSPSDVGHASLAAAPTDSMSTNSQAFDYGELDERSVSELHNLECKAREEYARHYLYLANIVSQAHEIICKELSQRCDNGAFSKKDNTFRAWCAYIGVSKDTAYRLLQVHSLITGATAEEQATLEAASPSLLYAAAKPSAPAELVQAVKDGDITTHKQYQEALAEIKARDAKIQELLEMSEGADRRADAADARAKKAEQERDAARGAQANLSAMVNKISEQRDAAEQRIEDAEQRAKEAERRAQAAEAEVKSWEADGQKMQEIVDDQQAVIEEQKIRIGELESGITVETTAADQEEIERRANELSEPLVKIIDQQNEQIERMASGNTVSAQASVLEQYLETMKASLLGNARRAELACYDVGALDSLAQALREFADEIDGLFEEGEENEE